MRLRAIVAFVVLFAAPARAQTLSETLDQLRRDFVELDIHREGVGLTELTSTYFVYGGRWNGTDVGAQRIEFAKIDRVTLQRGIFNEPGKKDLVRMGGRFERIDFAECKPGEGCHGARRDFLWNPSFAMKPDAPLERVVAFTEALKRAARLNGATLTDLPQYTPAASDPACPHFGRRIGQLFEQLTYAKVDTAEDSPNTFLYEGEFQRNACADPRTDSAEELARKIRYFVQRFQPFLTYGERGLDILKFAVRKENQTFLDDAIKWKLPLNVADRLGTVLDYIIELRNTAAMERSTEAYWRGLLQFYDREYAVLRQAGARHAYELPGGRITPPADAEGMWTGEITMRREFSNDIAERMNLALELRRLPAGGWSGTATIPQASVGNAALADIRVQGTELLFRIENGRPKQVFRAILPNGDLLSGTYNRDTLVPSMTGPGMVWVTAVYGFETRRTSGLRLHAERPLSAWEGEWASDGAEPRTLTLRVAGGRLVGTVTYRARTTLIEEVVDVARIDADRFRIVGTSYRALEGQVSSRFNLDFWDLELTPDGQHLYGLEGDVGTAAQPRTFIRRTAR